MNGRTCLSAELPDAVLTQPYSTLNITVIFKRSVMCGFQCSPSTSYVILRLDCSRMGGNLGWTSAVSQRRKPALGCSAFSSYGDKRVHTNKTHQTHGCAAGKWANGRNCSSMTSMASLRCYVRSVTQKADCREERNPFVLRRMQLSLLLFHIGKCKTKTWLKHWFAETLPYIFQKQVGPGVNLV